MKRTFLLVFIAGIISCTTGKQQSHPTAASNDKSHKYVRFSKFEDDTLQYLQKNFVENKERYEGKKFKKLLQDLQLAVKSYTYSTPLHSIKRIQIQV